MQNQEYEQYQIEQRARGSKKIKIKARKKKLIKRLLLFLVAILAIIGMYAYDFFYLEANNDQNQVRSLSIYQAIVSFLPRDNPQVYTYNSKIYLGLADSLYFFNIDQSYDYIWHRSHNFGTPILTGGGNYVALWQGRYTGFYLFDQTGLLFYKDLDILTVSVSDTGYVAVLKTERISVFDNTGTLVFYTYLTDPQVIPTAISTNGTYVAVSLMNISGLYITSSVVTFSFEAGLVSATSEQPGMIYSIDLDKMLDKPIVFADYVIVQNSRQFAGYKIIDDKYIQQWTFLSIPEPISLDFLGRYDQLLLQTYHRLYIIR